MASLCCLLTSFGGGAPVAAENTDQSLQALIDGVETHYNRARTLSLDFTEKYSVQGRPKRPESGSLLLRKPGRMRWQYTQPAGKLFVSDGKQIYLYTEADNRVEKTALKQSDDFHTPLAFLLGKLDMKREFKSFAVREADGGKWLTAEAKSDRAPYENLQLLIQPDYSISRVLASQRDGSTLDFSFSREVLNPKLADEQFRFAIPAGAEVVDAADVVDSMDNVAKGGDPQ